MRTHRDDWISSACRPRQRPGDTARADREQRLAPFAATRIARVPENSLKERKMRQLRMVFCSAAVLLLAIPTVYAQNPANEHNCPAQTGAGGGLEAEPPYVGSGHDGFSRNQSLCLPQLAPEIGRASCRERVCWSAAGR